MRNIAFALFYIVLFFCTFEAIYNIAKIVLRVPNERVSKALTGALSPKTNSVSFLTAFNDNLAITISKFITLNEYKKNRLAGYLYVAQMQLSPEEYTAQAILPMLECCVLAIPAYLINPLFTFVFIGAGIWLWYKSKQRVHKLIQDKQEQIDRDLPRFVTSLVTDLEYTHDALTILEKHKDDYSDYWSYEMSITIADMRSGNYIAALQRLRCRVRSKNLNDVVNELIMMVRGYDTANSWHTLETRFRELGLQELRKRAKLIPDKVHNLSLFLILGVLMIYGIVIGTVLVNSLSMFNI